MTKIKTLNLFTPHELILVWNSPISVLKLTYLLKCKLQLRLLSKQFTSQSILFLTDTWHIQTTAPKKTHKKTSFPYHSEGRELWIQATSPLSQILCCGQHGRDCFVFFPTQTNTMASRHGVLSCQDMSPLLTLKTHFLLLSWKLQPQTCYKHRMWHIMDWHI